MLLSWFLYDLSHHSDVKERVVAEIDAFRREHGNMDYVSATKGSSFRYLEAALCESLRYHPVVPNTTREAKQDVVIPSHIASPPFCADVAILIRGRSCSVRQLYLQLRATTSSASSLSLLFGVDILVELSEFVDVMLVDVGMAARRTWCSLWPRRRLQRRSFTPCWM